MYFLVLVLDGLHPYSLRTGLVSTFEACIKISLAVQELFMHGTFEGVVSSLLLNFLWECNTEFRFNETLGTQRVNALLQNIKKQRGDSLQKYPVIMFEIFFVQDTMQEFPLKYATTCYILRNSNNV